MITLLRREFTVDVALQQAWDHLARIEEWPSWAKHIRRIELSPPCDLGPDSTGVIYLAGGMKSAFKVTEFNPLHNWEWAGPIVWMRVFYDHRFEVIDAQRTKLIWTVAAEGLGASTIGRLFAALYRRNMERAIARLVDEMQAFAAPLTTPWDA
jgi:hypothetical protein